MWGAELVFPVREDSIVEPEDMSHLLEEVRNVLSIVVGV
jgi:hypothetical protein